MSAKFFFERFWESEQRNELFVCMPFHDAFDSRFKDIIVPASKEVGFDSAIRVKEDVEGNVIMTKILDGIANSKMVLIDFTDDPKSACVHSRHVNGNVLYEAGIANAMRESSAIVMIRDQDPATADFDVRGLTINQPKGETLTKDWLSTLLRASLEKHNWSESKRVKAAAESIDDMGLMLMNSIGCYPKDRSHFNTLKFKLVTKISVLRLLDLGILWFATGKSQNPAEHAYHWTPFGYEVMKYLGLKPLTIEEFKKMPGYKESEVAKKKYEEYRKKLESSLKRNKVK